MKEVTKSDKKILKPSIIHDDLFAMKNPPHLMEKDADNLQPENPERNYHHDEIKDLSSSNDGVEQGDQLGREDG